MARELLLVGGGHSHALALRMLGMRPIEGVRVTLVSDVSHAPYSGMLPGHIAGFYSWEEMHIDLRRLCQWAGARFVHAAACGLDPAARTLHLKGRPPLRFDAASINVGSMPVRDEVPGVRRFATPAKPVPVLLEKWGELCRLAAEGPIGPIVVVGGGAGGIELALSLQAHLERLAPAPPPLTVVQSAREILPGHNARVRRLLTQELVARGIRMLTDCRVAEVRADAVLCEAGETLPAAHVFWVTNAGPPPWLAESGLPLDEDGFLAVEETLQSPGCSAVFGAGDAVTVLGARRPKSGVFAVRAAAPLVANLRRHFAAQPLRPWKPQKNFLSLIGNGRGEAVASRHRLAVRGRAVWQLKDWIDRRFMRKFQELPPMRERRTGGFGRFLSGPPPEAHADAGPAESAPLEAVLQDLRRRAEMRCLGCAAKVGGPSLSRMMERLHRDFPAAFEGAEAGVLTGLESPDDAAVLRLPAGEALVQTVDYLPSLVGDPHLFGRIAALHCFSDIFAMGARAHSALLTALTPFAAEAVSEETLYQMVGGVLVEMQSMGAVLLGGHTAESPALALALTCNGLSEPSSVLHKGGLREGDVLILTKPLGVGALFAGEMRLAVRGHWMDAAIESMLRSNQRPAEILRRCGASALTDVTGFGLLGHLLEMLRGSGCGAEIDLPRLPLLPGAIECARRGILSSLHPANSRALAAVANAAEFSSDPALPLLFDPQTSGGLLAAVPARNAAECLDALQECAPHSAVVGRVLPAEDPEAPVSFGRGG